MDSFFDDGGGDVMFTVVPIFIAVVFCIVFGTILFGVVRGLTRWQRNNNSPVTTVPATVVGKRGHVSGGSGDSSASTTYYVTFEVQGGERVELRVAGREYGTLIERDRGQLTYQGTRYKGFDRSPNDR